MEIKILSDFRFQRVKENLDMIVIEYEHAHKFGQEYAIEYILEYGNKFDVANAYVSQIMREAEIRTFKAKVELVSN